jgi:hypothetical protein
MNQDLIKNLDNDLLLELYKEISSNLTYQRKAWLDNEKSRTEHLKSLILETREELEFAQLQLQFRKLKEE